jgi:hypothetical protein
MFHQVFSHLLDFMLYTFLIQNYQLFKLSREVVSAEESRLTIPRPC